MSVSLRHPITGEVRVHPEGWSWSCFLGAAMLGVPLFQRGLQVWGAAMLALDIGMFALGWSPDAGAQALYAWMSGVALAASAFFGWKANKMAINRALLNGWEYADPHRARCG